MFIDVIVLILLVTALFKGIRKGLVVAVFSFLGFLLGLAAALKLSATVADYLGQNISVSQRWLPVLAFILVFAIVVILVRLGAKIIEKGLKLVLLNWVNRIGGFLFFALLYLFIFSIVLFYADNLHLISKETIRASVTFPILAPLGPKVIEGLGYILPFFKNMFTQLTGFFDHLKA